MNRKTKRKMKYRPALYMYLLKQNRQLNRPYWADLTGQHVGFLKRGI